MTTEWINRGDGAGNSHMPGDSVNQHNFSADSQTEHLHPSLQDMRNLNTYLAGSLGPSNDKLIKSGALPGMEIAGIGGHDSKGNAQSTGDAAASASKGSSEGTVGAPQNHGGWGDSGGTKHSTNGRDHDDDGRHRHDPAYSSKSPWSESPGISREDQSQSDLQPSPSAAPVDQTASAASALATTDNATPSSAPTSDNTAPKTVATPDNTTSAAAATMDIASPTSGATSGNPAPATASTTDNTAPAVSTTTDNTTPTATASATTDNTSALAASAAPAGIAGLSPSQLIYSDNMTTSAGYVNEVTNVQGQGPGTSWSDGGYGTDTASNVSFGQNGLQLSSNLADQTTSSVTSTYTVGPDGTVNTGGQAYTVQIESSASGNWDGAWMLPASGTLSATNGGVSVGAEELDLNEGAYSGTNSLAMHSHAPDGQTVGSVTATNLNLSNMNTYDWTIAPAANGTGSVVTEYVDGQQQGPSMTTATNYNAEDMRLILSNSLAQPGDGWQDNPIQTNTPYNVAGVQIYTGLPSTQSS